jgi:Tol biopolymer transport system component
VSRQPEPLLGWFDHRNCRACGVSKEVSMSRNAFVVFVTAMGFAAQTAPGARLNAGQSTSARPKADGFAGRGSKIAMTVDRDGQDQPDEIYVMNADGSEEQRVTPLGHACNANSPRYQPDGYLVAFYCFARDGTTSEIYLTDGYSMTALTHMADVGQRAGFPSWSPDGTQIAFQTLNGTAGIYIIDAAGLTAPQFINNGGRPDWSPDGTKIAFNRSLGVWVMQIDNPSAEVRLTDTSTASFFPRWSPDGTKLTFNRTETVGPYAGIREVWMMNPDGTDQRQMTTFLGNNDIPSFSPNGHFILFYRQLCDPSPLRSPNGNDLFAVTTDLSQVTQNPKIGTAER